VKGDRLPTFEPRSIRISVLPSRRADIVPISKQTAPAMTTKKNHAIHIDRFAIAPF
jgi:hypothetical protein